MNNNHNIFDLKKFFQQYMDCIMSTDYIILYMSTYIVKIS